MIFLGFLFLVVLVVVWRRARASKLAGLSEAAPIHSVMVGPRTRRVSPLKGERL